MKNILLQGLIVWFSLNSLVLADLIRPSNNSEISFIHVLFEWDQEADANEYNLQLSKSSNFQNLLIDESILENVYIYKGEIDWDDGYYWRVRPIDADGNVGDWVNTFTFEIESTMKISKKNYRIFEVGISYEGRTVEEGKKIKFVDGIKAILAIFKYKFFS